MRVASLADTRRRSVILFEAEILHKVFGSPIGAIARLYVSSLLVGIGDQVVARPASSLCPVCSNTVAFRHFVKVWSCSLHVECTGRGSLSGRAKSHHIVCIVGSCPHPPDVSRTQSMRQDGARRVGFCQECCWRWDRLCAHAQGRQEDSHDGDRCHRCEPLRGLRICCPRRPCWNRSCAIVSDSFANDVRPEQVGRRAEL